jgi:hypothetical protein
MTVRAKYSLGVLLVLCVINRYPSWSYHFVSDRFLVVEDNADQDDTMDSSKAPWDQRLDLRSAHTRPNALSFCDQLDFIERLSELVESLRFIDRPLRTQVLCNELEKWNENPDSLGWDPTGGVGTLVRSAYVLHPYI